MNTGVTGTSILKKTSAPAAITEEERKAVEETDLRKILKKVIVNRLNVAEGNQDLVITVNDVGAPDGRKSFEPGQEVVLTQAQINILNEAVERNHIDIPAGSGIYQDDNPREKARQQYPGFVVGYNSKTGLIFVEKHRPNYAIIEVG
jgi:hypothetical protein